MTAIAWGDESIRSNNLSQPLYLLGASLIDSDFDEVRQQLNAAKPAGSSKLHWREMSDRTRRSTIKLLESFDSWHCIVCSEVLRPGKEERCRRKCMERLLPFLESSGISALCLESRSQRENDRDISLVRGMRQQGRLVGLRVEHLKGDQDPLLWIPDAVLGTYGSTICGIADYSPFIHDHVLMEQISAA